MNEEQEERSVYGKFVSSFYKFLRKEENNQDKKRDKENHENNKL